jgi:hypothetical protein
VYATRGGWPTGEALICGRSIKLRLGARCSSASRCPTNFCGNGIELIIRWFFNFLLLFLCRVGVFELMIRVHGVARWWIMATGMLRVSVDRANLGEGGEGCDRGGGDLV